MMQIYFGLYLIVFASVSLAAPPQKRFKEHAAAPEASSNAKEVENEESALQSLVPVSGEKSKPHGESFIQSHSVSFSNVNGNKAASEEGHKKVVEDGILVKDLKQHVTEYADKENVPHKIVQTEVNIPEKGVHKTLTSFDGNPAKETTEDNDDDGSIQLYPTDVAKYLLETDKIEEFESILNASSMTEDEANRYREAVKSEYNRLLEEYLEERLYGTDDFADLDGFNEQMFDDVYETPDRRSMPPYGDDSMIENLPLYEDESDDLFNKLPFLTKDIEDQYSAYSYKAMIRKVIEDWLRRAIATGDRQDEALVANAARFVANDDDPNDEEQIKELLEDFVAQSILDELSGLNYDPSYDAKQADEQLPLMNQEQPTEENAESSEPETNKSKIEDEKTPESQGTLENDLKETVQNHRM